MIALNQNKAELPKYRIFYNSYKGKYLVERLKITKARFKWLTRLSDKHTYNTLNNKGNFIPWDLYGTMIRVTPPKEWFEPAAFDTVVEAKQWIDSLEESKKPVEYIYYNGKETNTDVKPLEAI